MSQTFIPVTNSNGSFLATDWFTPGPAIQQDEVRNDKDIDFSITPANLLPANSETPYTSDFETGDQFQMAIGNFDAPPTSGSVSLEVGSTTSGLTAIPYNVSVSALQSALNAALTIEAKPQCVVTLAATGNYKISGATNGAITTGFFSVVNDALLYPVSDAFFVEGALGDADSPYQLLFVMRQAPMCYAEATVETSEADVAIETVQAGDVTHNKIQRISFNIPQVFSGGYTINATANAVVATCGVGTPLMTATQLGLVLAQHPEIKFSEQNGDPDNIKVTVVGQSWVVEFIDTLANDDTNELSVANNPDGPLMGPKGCTGTIDYNTFGLYVYSLGQSDNTFQLTRSITRTRASGERRTLYSGPVTIYKDLIDAQTAIPTPMPSYYTTTQSDARFVKMVPGTSTMQSGSEQEFGSGSILTLDAGSSVTVDGSMDGTPTGGTLDLSAVDVTLNDVTLGRYYAELATDQSITSTTTYTDATGVTFTLPAGTWIVEWFSVFGNADVTPTANVILDYGGVSCGTSSVGIYGVTGGASQNIPWPGTAAMSQAFDCAQFGGVLMQVRITNASSAVIKMQFKQVTTSVNAVTLKAGSYIAARKAT